MTCFNAFLSNSRRLECSSSKSKTSSNIIRHVKIALVVDGFGKKNSNIKAYNHINSRESDF